MIKQPHRRQLAAAVAGVALLCTAVGTATAAAPVPVDSTPAVARPTPYVVARQLVQLEGGRPLQWQVTTPVPVTGEYTPFTASAPLFVFTDDMIELASQSPPVGSVIIETDEVAALASGTRWALRAPSGYADATVFGLGHAEGGTAPVGTPFTLAAGGWHQLEVRAYQLLPGEFAEVGDDTMGTLLIGRSGVFTTTAGTHGVGAALSTARSVVHNEGPDVAVFLTATVTPVPGVADVPGAPASAPPPPTAPPTTIAAPAGGGAGGGSGGGSGGGGTTSSTTSTTTSTSTTTDPDGTWTIPVMTAVLRLAPTAVDDSATLQPRTTQIHVPGDPWVYSYNVLTNDSRGIPAANVVAVGGQASRVGEVRQLHPGIDVRIDANGMVTFNVHPTNEMPATIGFTSSYTIANLHGESTARIDFTLRLR